MTSINLYLNTEERNDLKVAVNDFDTFSTVRISPPNGNDVTFFCLDSEKAEKLRAALSACCRDDSKLPPSLPVIPAVTVPLSLDPFENDIPF